MRVLIVGAGVIGTVYGAHLGAAGHVVSVLSHPPRTDEIAARGLAARDLLDGSRTETRVSVVPDAAAGLYDLVLVAVRTDRLGPACTRLAGLTGRPTVLFFGNNPGGRSAIPAVIPGQVALGFPGVGGVLRDGVAEYVRIRQQPTALQDGSDPRLAEMAEAIRPRGFLVQRVTDMDGWLVYHTAFVACVCAALYRSGATGLPRNLAILHGPALRPVAVRYWARTMRSPTGELCFAAHARHAPAEMRALAEQVTARLADTPATSHVFQLLEGSLSWPTRGI